MEGTPQTADSIASGTRPPLDDLVLNQLDREIVDLEREGRPEGWTTWALLGSLAVGAWLGVNEVYTSAFSWGNVGRILLAVYLSLIIARVIHLGANRGSFPLYREPRYEWLPGLRRIHLELFVEILAWGVVAGIAMSATVQLPEYVRNCLLVQALLEALGTLQLVLLGALPIPLSRSALARPGVVVIAVLAGLFLTIPALAGICMSLWDTRLHLTAAEWRIGGLAGVGLLVVAHLAAAARADPRIEVLRQMRREFCLGRVDIQALVVALDALGTGLRVEHAMEPWINNVIGYCQMVRQAVATKNAEMQVLLAKTSNGSTPLSPGDRVQARVVLSTCEECVREARRGLARLRLARLWLQVAGAIATLFDPDAKALVETSMARVTPECEGVDAECRTFDSNSRRLYRAL